MYQVDLIQKQIIEVALPLYAFRAALIKALLGRTNKRREKKWGAENSSATRCQNQRQKNDTSADLFPIDPAAARVTSNFNPTLRTGPRSAPRWGLTSGDDADVSVVHASVFRPFPEAWVRRAGRRPAGSSCCCLWQFSGREKEAAVRCEQKASAQAVEVFFFFPHIEIRRNVLSRYLPEKTKHSLCQCCLSSCRKEWIKSCSTRWNRQVRHITVHLSSLLSMGQMATGDKSTGFRKCHRMHGNLQQGYKIKRVNTKQVECEKGLPAD